MRLIQRLTALTMWPLLEELGSLGIYSDPGEEPMRNLVEQLSRREYADRLHAHTSLGCLYLTDAVNYEASMLGHDEIGIDYHSRRSLFRVEYHEWMSATRNPRFQKAVTRDCEHSEAVEFINCLVLRLLLCSRSRIEFMAAHRQNGEAIETILESFRARFPESLLGTWSTFGDGYEMEYGLAVTFNVGGTGELELWGMEDVDGVGQKIPFRWNVLRDNHIEVMPLTDGLRDDWGCFEVDFYICKDGYGIESIAIQDANGRKSDKPFWWFDDSENHPLRRLNH